MKDAMLHLSGLYKVYSKRLEKEILSGDLPNHLALILDGIGDGQEKILACQKMDIGEELMQ